MILKVAHVITFNDIRNINGLNLDNILIDEKWYKNFLIYNAAHRISCGGKPLRIIFDKVDGCIKKHDRPKYLGLFQCDEKNE